MEGTGFVGRLVPFDVSALKEREKTVVECNCVPVILDKGSRAIAGKVEVSEGSITFCSSCGTLTGRKRAVVIIDGVRQRLKVGQIISVSVDI